jgi:hypothetical protein
VRGGKFPPSATSAVAKRLHIIGLPWRGRNCIVWTDRRHTATISNFGWKCRASLRRTEQLVCTNFPYKIGIMRFTMNYRCVIHGRDATVFRGQ